MASQLSGLRSATIRAWEKRYQVVTPERAENKHRLYSELDIEKLTLLAQLTELGQNIGKIAKLDLEELKRVYQTVMKKPYEQRDFSETSRDKLNFDKTLTNLSLAISNFKLDIIFHELTKIKHILTVEEIALSTLPFIFEMIDKKLNKGDITKGEVKILEHLIQQHFASLLLQNDQKSLEKAFIISSSIPTYSQRNLLTAELLFTAHQRPYLTAGYLSPKELALTMISLKITSLFLYVQEYQLTIDQNLDQYLDELVRFLTFSPHIMINGPMGIQERVTRKSCHFVTSLGELDLFLEKK